MKRKLIRCAFRVISWAVYLAFPFIVITAVCYAANMMLTIAGVN